MRRSLLILFIFSLFAYVTAEGEAAAAEWIPLPHHVPVAYFDRDSIQYPYSNYYEFGLFSIGKTDKNIVRIWTKLDLPSLDSPHVLYEIKISDRMFKAIHAVDRHGNRIPPFDSDYRPIMPGSMEEDLFRVVKEENSKSRNPLAGLSLEN